MQYLLFQSMHSLEGRLHKLYQYLRNLAYILDSSNLLLLLENHQKRIQNLQDMIYMLTVLLDLYKYLLHSSSMLLVHHLNKYLLRKVYLQYQSMQTLEGMGHKLYHY